MTPVSSPLAVVSLPARLGASAFPLTLYYDGACPLCLGEMRNLMLRNVEGRLRFVDIADPAFQPPAAPAPGRVALAQRLHAQTVDGRWLSGVAVFIEMYDAVGLSWVARCLGGRGVRPLAERLYPWIARNRHRFPRWLAHWVFETAMRRAARRAAATACASGACRREGG